MNTGYLYFIFLSKIKFACVTHLNQGPILTFQFSDEVPTKRRATVRRSMQGLHQKQLIGYNDVCNFFSPTNIYLITFKAYESILVGTLRKQQLNL